MRVSTGESHMADDTAKEDAREGEAGGDMTQEGRTY